MVGVHALILGAPRIPPERGVRSLHLGPGLGRGPLDGAQVTVSALVLIGDVIRLGYCCFKLADIIYNMGNNQYCFGHGILLL